MEVLGKLGTVHPLVLVAWGALILVDGLLLYHAVRHFQQYMFSRNWPRIVVSADAVDVQRVDYVRQGKPGTEQHYEAVFSYRYAVDGRQYVKQTARPVANREEAERLKERAMIAFIYDPNNPEETLEKTPNETPMILILLGLLTVNGIGIGLIRNITAFLSEGP